MWYDVVEEAEEMVDTDISCDLQGYDIDPDMIRIARANAKQAGVDHLIHFQQRDVADLKHSKKIRFYHYQSAVWRTPGGQEGSSGTLYDDRTGLS